MRRAALNLILLLTAVPALAHLNHFQFATVEESGGLTLVRYRMSADMFLSNLDAGIKAGSVSQKVKSLPIAQMIGAYFSSHLLLKTAGAPHPADSVDFQFDEKNGDWIAEFHFASAGNGPFELFCDAFLENNPHTQTLARIDWRGEQAVFHFRQGNVVYALNAHAAGSAAEPLAASRSENFLDGLAAGLKEYACALILAAVFVFLRLKSSFFWQILGCFTVLWLFSHGTAELAKPAGWLLGFAALGCTAQELGFRIKTLLKERLQ